MRFFLFTDIVLSVTALRIFLIYLHWQAFEEHSFSGSIKMSTGWYAGRAELQALGFTGFKTIGELKANALADIPREPGVYVILREEDAYPAFLENSTGGRFKQQDPNVDHASLKTKWVSGTPVVYVGKAGKLTGSATLRSRLKQYFDFGAGKPIGHWGGRYIWHLPSSENLLVAWMPTPGQEPRQVEAKLIQEFNAAYGCLPFANLCK